MGCRKLIFLFLFQLFFSGILSAQSASDTFALPQPWKLSRLDNGLQLAVLQDTSLPITWVQMSFRAGSAYEPRRMSGWSCLMTSMLTASNRQYPVQDSFKKFLSREGILFDHFVSPEVLTFRLQGMSDKSDLLHSAFIAAVQQPLLSAGEVARAKERMIQQAEEEMTDPLYFLRQELQSRMWGKEMHRLVPTGIPTGIARVDSAGLSFFRKHFIVPYRALLLVVSPDSPEQVQQQVNKYYARWTDAAPDPDVVFPTTDSPVSPDPELFIVSQEFARIPVFMAGWRLPDEVMPWAQILTDVLNDPQGSFRKNMRDTLKVRDMQFQVSGKGMYLTLIPDPRNYLRMGPDSLMIQLRKLCEPGFFNREEIRKAVEASQLRNWQNSERMSDRVTHISEIWGEKKTDPDYARLSPEFLQQQAISVFLKQSLKAGFLTNSELTAVTGLKDFFHDFTYPDSLQYSLEGDSVYADSAISDFVSELGYWLNWNPAHRMKLQVYIPSREIADPVWEVRKIMIQSLISRSLSENLGFPSSRIQDVQLEFIKDPDARIPGISAPLKENEVAVDEYQFYVVPKVFRYDAP